MKNKLLLPLAVLVSVASSAMADPFYNTNTPAAYHDVPQITSYPYIGGAFALTSVSDDYFEYYPDYGYTDQTDIDYSSLMFQAGYQVNSYIAAEFRYWFSLNSGDYSTNTLYSLNPGAYDSFDAWGMYLKPMYPVTPEFSIYGLLGFAGVTVDADYGSYLLYNDSSFSWGLGASFDVTPNIALFIDYVDLFNDTLEFYEYSQKTKVNTFNFGVTYKF